MASPRKENGDFSGLSQADIAMFHREVDRIPSIRPNTDTFYQDLEKNYSAQPDQPTLGSPFLDSLRLIHQVPDKTDVFGKRTATAKEVMDAINNKQRPPHT